MSTDSPSERPADPEQTDSSFAKGEAHPDQYADEDEVGRFSKGQEELGEEDPEKHIQGRFSEGQEELDEPRGRVP